MKYLCMIFYNERKLDELAEQDFQALIDESLEYDDVLRRNDHFIGAQALERAATATTVRIVNGRISMTDGPFAETHEQIGGFILLEARDLDEAIRLASKIPAGHLGGVEVRPIKELAAVGTLTN